MARDVSGQVWAFDGTGQGEGVANTDTWLRIGTFTAASTDIVTMAGHKLQTGAPVRVEEGSNNDLPAGLAEDTDYWVGVIDANTFKLYTTNAAALATGTAVDVTDAGTTPNYILMKPVYDHTIFVKYITIDAGAAGGSFEVTTSSGGRTLTGALTIAANAHDQIVINDFVEGVYMTTMTDGQILVAHGKAFC